MQNINKTKTKQIHTLKVNVMLLHLKPAYKKSRKKKIRKKNRNNNITKLFSTTNLYSLFAKRSQLRKLITKEQYLQKSQ